MTCNRGEMGGICDQCKLDMDDGIRRIVREEIQEAVKEIQLANADMERRLKAKISCVCWRYTATR